MEDERNQAIEWVHSLTTLGIKPGLKRMEWMLARLECPLDKQRFVHIGGTNGKGSTLTFMRHILQRAGYRVGAFTSPYIVRFENRIQVNGQDIGDKDLVALVALLKPLAEELAQTDLGSPTEFEIVTMIALMYFATVTQPDLILCEVGLGGRLDSTNVISPLLAVITNVGYDHMHILGNSIEQIAFEKAGIIKQGTPLVTGAQNKQAYQVIQNFAQEQNATMYSLGEAFHIQPEKYTQTSQTFSYHSIYSKYTHLHIHLMGEHQIQNASLAIMAIDLLIKDDIITCTAEDVRQGLQETLWPGRMEIISQQPLTIIDGAHNPEGIEALAHSIDRYFQGQRVTVFFSVMKDKQIHDMLQLLDGRVDQLVFTEFDFPRVAGVDDLRRVVEECQQKWTMTIQFERDWVKAYKNLQKKHSSRDVVLFTGSLYFISEVRKKI